MENEFILSEISNQKVVQSNDLITSVARMDKLPLKFFEIAVASLDISNIPKDRTVYVRKDVLFDYFDMNGASKNSRLSKVLRDLHEQSTFHIRFIDDNGKMTEKNISPIEETSFNHFGDTVSIQFTEKIMPYLVDLKQNFTQYEISEIANLKSKYGIILYKFLSMYYNQYNYYLTKGIPNEKKSESMKNPIVSVEELRRITNTKKEYDLFNNFKNRVIASPLKEITKHTSFNVDFEVIRTGRSATHIKFFIDKKKIAKNEFYKEEQQDEGYKEQVVIREQEKQELAEKARQSPYTDLLMDLKILPYIAMSQEDIMMNLQLHVYPRYDYLEYFTQNDGSVSAHLRYVKENMKGYSEKKQNIVSYLLICVNQRISQVKSEINDYGYQ